MNDLSLSKEREFVERQFVHSIIISEVQSPTELWNWKQLLNIEQFPNIAIALLLDIYSDGTRLVSDRQKFTLRQQVTSKLQCDWPQMLAMWHEDLECIILLVRNDGENGATITDEVEQNMAQIDLPFSTNLYAGISRIVDGPTWLPSAVRHARAAAKHAKYAGYPHKMVCHVEDMELVDEYSMKAVGGIDAESTLENDIRTVNRLFHSTRRSGSASLEVSKRAILEALVSLVNHSRVQGVPADESLLNGTSLFSTLLKVSDTRELNSWIEESGFIFLKKLTDLADQTRPQMIEKAMEYITKFLHEDLELEKIAAHCLVSHFYLSHLFRKETGITVTAFIKKTRMDKAMELLKCTDYSIADVAYRVGYQDPNYFSKSFRTYVGTTPTEFRRSLRNK